MNPGDRVTLPDKRTGIIWRVADGFVWVSIDAQQFAIEKWRAVDVVLRYQDLSGQLRLPFEETT